MTPPPRALTTFTKADLVEALSKQLCFTKRTAKLFTAQFFNAIAEILANGEWIKLSGVGKFVLRDKVSRPGRNPKTKAAVPVSARRVVTFRPSQLFKHKLTQLNRFYEEIQQTEMAPPQRFEEIRALLEKADAAASRTAVLEDATQVPA